MTYYLALLGGCECRAPDGAAVVMPNRKARALLAYLATDAGRRVERGFLATLFWGESGEVQARANLRKTLSRLRQALPEGLRPCLLADAERIALTGDAI